MRPFAPPPPAAQLIERRFRAMLPFRSYMVVAVLAVIASRILLLSWMWEVDGKFWWLDQFWLGWNLGSAQAFAGVWMGLAVSRLLRSTRLMEEVALLPDSVDAVPQALRWIVLKAALITCLVEALIRPLIDDVLLSAHSGKSYLRAERLLPDLIPSRTIWALTPSYGEPQAALPAIIDGVLLSSCTLASDLVAGTAVCLLAVLATLYVLNASRATCGIVSVLVLVAVCACYQEFLWKASTQITALLNPWGASQDNLWSKARFDARRALAGLLAPLWAWPIYLWGDKRLRRKLAARAE